MRNPDRELGLDGRRRVRDVLGALQIDPDTVLVIRGRTLLTRDEWLEPSDEIEVRPVISGGSGSKASAMWCKRCGSTAVIELRRHNTAFCQGCFEHHVRVQVQRAIDEHRMFAPDDRVLIAVSGGKDSLALWDILLDLGYD